MNDVVAITSKASAVAGPSFNGVPLKDKDE
jgi:hypothetical protein